MDHNTGLFVQAFWVKCREVIRPEIDAAIGDIRRAGHDANVSTQEYSQVAARLPAHVGPVLPLALKPAGATEGMAHPTIEFHFDIAHEAIDIVTSDGRKQSREIAALGSAEVNVAINQCLDDVAASAPL